jgi:rsbT co-antagonist protein RsbR
VAPEAFNQAGFVLGPGEHMASPVDRFAERDVAQEMGLDEQTIERRQRLVGLGPEDVLRLGRIRDEVVRHAEEFTSAFFGYLAGIEDAREALRNRQAVDAAKKLKAEHLVAMVQGTYGVPYVQQRLKLGLLYSRMGLDPRMFLAAFSHLLRTIGARVTKSARTPEEGFEDFASLQKVGFFDISLILDVMVFERERTIRQQQDAIRDLSTPVLQIRDRLLMLPIIGTIDTHRARMLTEGLLHAIRTSRAKVVVMDVTGVAAVDTKVANHLLQTVAAARLMGASMIVTGLSADVAQTMVNLGVDLGRLATIGDLQGGIEEAERLIGYQVVRVAPGTSPDVAR